MDRARKGLAPKQPKDTPVAPVEDVDEDDAMAGIDAEIMRSSRRYRRGATPTRSQPNTSSWRNALRTARSHPSPAERPPCDTGYARSARCSRRRRSSPCTSSFVPPARPASSAFVRLFDPSTRCVAAASDQRAHAAPPIPGGGSGLRHKAPQTGRIAAYLSTTRIWS
jgi:hypothetical protein